MPVSVSAYRVPEPTNDVLPFLLQPVSTPDLLNATAAQLSQHLFLLLLNLGLHLSSKLFFFFFFVNLYSISLNTSS